MPRDATLEERIAWHVEHEHVCGCRPIPGRLLAAMSRRGHHPRRRPGRPARAPLH